MRITAAVQLRGKASIKVCILKKKCAVGDFAISRGLELTVSHRSTSKQISKSDWELFSVVINLFYRQHKNNPQAKIKFTFLTKSVQRLIILVDVVTTPFQPVGINVRMQNPTAWNLKVNQ